MKSKILVSACLMGEHVRYDGKHSLISHPVLAEWQQQGRLISTCPEMAGGLQTPRAPAEIQHHFPILIQDCNGIDVTPEFLAGAEHTVELSQHNACCCALMKANSPSCGNRKIYDGSFSGTLTKGAGIAAQELTRAGIPVFNEHEIDLLIAFVQAQDTQLPYTNDATQSH